MNVSGGHPCGLEGEALKVAAAQAARSAGAELDVSTVAHAHVKFTLPVTITTPSGVDALSRALNLAAEVVAWVV